MESHRSYVLRCLRVAGVAEQDQRWRFSIQEACPDAQKRAFSSLEDLADFLRRELEYERIETHREARL